MKFLVDAHLPPSLCEVLRAAGHQAVHTCELAQKNATTDDAINELSVAERWIVVTKDADFYHSHVLHGKPWKLLLVRTGNIGTRDLKALVERHLAVIAAGFAEYSLVEIDRQRVQAVQ